MRSMRTTYCIAIFSLLFGLPIWVSAHGPQIQITVDNNKISTREVFFDGPYSDRLASAKSVYVVPLREFNGAWYSRPNGKLNALNLPEFFSGPGFAFGYDQADGGAQDFAVGTTLSLQIGALRFWNGAAFVDAGATELEAFRGSSASPTAIAKSSDAATTDLLFATLAAGYGSESHATVRYRMLGDGLSPVVPPADGIYLLDLRLKNRNDQTDLLSSDPFQFVLHKNIAQGVVDSAIASLGKDSSTIQIMPEPTSSMLLVVVGGIAIGIGRRRRVRSADQFQA